MEQNKTPLLDGIEELGKTNQAYFRIPGHRLENGISDRWTSRVGKEIFAYDVTETPYTDDLHAPEGAILEAQELMADVFHAQKSFFLVNGTTCGNEAMILANAVENERILVARNAHKSAMMGMILSGAKPVYVMPKTIEDWGIQGGISPADVEKCLKENPDCKAFFMVNPSYYGVTSDVEAIAKVCHKYGVKLLVDEAHGGHLYFHKALPKGALEQGADMCVQSMHKVTGALTQSSVLHVNSTDIDLERVSTALHLVQSTSPSYLLMASLDCARYELALHGQEMMQHAMELSQYAREQINRIPGFSCMGEEIVGKNAVAGLDATRLTITAKELGLSGYALDEKLFDRGVNMELSDAWNALAVVTYANTKQDMDKLVLACKEISHQMLNRGEQPVKYDNCVRKLPEIPEQIHTPRQAYFAEKKEISWQDAVGSISAEMIAPYPPGIPVIYPGEVITKEIFDYLEFFRKEGRHIHGSKDGKLNTIRILHN